MKLKYFLIITIFYIFNTTAYSQVDIQYQPPNGGVISVYETQDIISDFGLRDNNSLFHRGIDLNKTDGTNDVGFSILSPNAGIVSFLDAVGYKIIVIDANDQNGIDNHQNFGYGHIFNDNALPIVSGDFVLLNLNAPLQDEVAILNTVTNVAISDYAGGGGQVTYPVGNPNPINVTNVVNMNQAFAPVGGSGGFNNGPHLHLYLAINPNNTPNDLNNAKDPLQFISNPHPNTDYSLEVEQLHRLTESGTANFYSGANTASVQVRCTMLNIGNGGNPMGYPGYTYYAAAVMDIDDVLLFIKPVGTPIERCEDWGNTDNSNYQLVIGQNFESKISLGARLNHNRYPSIGFPPTNNTIDISTRRGTDLATGIFPVAYDNDEYDDYFFSDIFTRIADDDNMGDGQNDWASINEDARYPDGDYELHIRAVDVNSDVHSSNDPTTITIDNFRPYISKVEICNPNGNPIYTYEWVKNGDNLVLQESGTNELLNPNLPVVINFWSSEPLNNDGGVLIEPSIELNGQDAEYVSNIGGKQWTFKFDNGFSSGLAESSVYDIIISAIDRNQNWLIDMPDETSIIALANMPVRNGAGFTNPINLTDNETFSIAGCYVIENLSDKTSDKKTVNVKAASVGCNSPEGNTPLPSSEFSYSLGGAENNVVTFTNNSESGAFYYWDFGDGTTAYDENPAPHTYPLEALSTAYEVSLSVTNLDGQTVITTKNVLIPGTDEPAGSETISIIGNRNQINETTETIEYDFDYHAQADNPDFTFTYTLDFGDGTISSSELYHNYYRTFSTKTYFPVLTVSAWNNGEFIGNYQFNYPSITVSSLPDLDLEITFSVSSDNPSNAILRNKLFNLTASTNNGLGKHTFTWAIYPNNLNVHDDPGIPDEETNYVLANSNTLENIYFYNPGQYLITLTVNDQYGHNGYKEFIANVVSDAGCAEMSMYISECASQWEVPTGQPVSFAVDYSLTNCGGENYSAGKIEWSMKKPNGSTISLGCSYVPEDFNHTINNRKCIEFDSPGEYIVTAKIIPYEFYDNPVDGITYTKLLNCTDYSVVSKTVKAIDCSSEIYIDKSVTYPNTTNTWNVESANIYLNNKSTNNVVLNSGSHTSFLASNKINIKNNFSAKAGSYFSAKLDPCPSAGCTSCSPDYSCPVSPFMYDCLPNDAIKVHLWEESCALGHGVYGYSFTIDEEYKGTFIGDLSVQCYENKECADPDKNTFCDDGCIHSTSIRKSVVMGEKVYNEYYGTLLNKVKLIARLELKNAKGTKYSSDEKIGCVFASSTLMDGDSLFVNSQLNFNEDELFDFVIYPNPAQNSFELKITGDYRNTNRIEIYNHLGQLIQIQSKGITQINYYDIQNWPYGLYAVRLIDKEGNVISKKLVKE